MREIHTIEVERWKPSETKGMVKFDGMISPQQAFEALKKHLEEVGLLPDEYFLPGMWKFEKQGELPYYNKAVCSVNWGGSEGIYIDISLLYCENNEIKYFDFATGKTLGQSGDDFLRMSRISAECSMMLNGRGSIVRFEEEDKYISESKNSIDKQIAIANEHKNKNDFVEKVNGRDFEREP